MKVTDFGIARITDSSKTKTGMVLGTPSYMSPEQLAGKKIDGRSDLFSLGVTLYQLLCGKLPFAGRVDGAAHVQDRQRAAGRHPDATTRSCRRRWSTVIDKALAKEPDERFQTGEEMAQAMRACRQRRQHATRPRWTSTSSPDARAWQPELSPRSRDRHPSGHGALAQRGQHRRRRARSGWRCWPTAWAATTPARWRAASRWS